MNVSVIVPVRDAADTLPDTIASLRAQTLPEWEAIVVENGSTDGTAAVADGLAARDARVRVLRLREEGASAARNAGLRAARHDWVLFLDGDDRILPSFLETITREIERDPSLDGAYCGAIRVTEEGETAGLELYPAVRDLFEDLTRTCTWCIHCVVVRKARVLEVGGFDESLATCEDWLLWQRLARSGARFARVPEYLAVYRVRPSSASMDGLRMAADMIRVVTIGHGPDGAVPRPLPRLARGMPAERAPGARLASLAWAAALLVGRGEDGSRVLDLVPEDRDPGLDPEDLAASVHVASRFPRSLPEGAWPRLWPEVEPLVRKLFEAYERQAGAPHLARRAMRALESLLLQAPGWERDRTIGTTRFVRLEATEPFRDLHVPPPAERVECAVFLQGEPVGTTLLPVCDGLVPATVLADAVAAELALTILDRYWERGAGRDTPRGLSLLSSVGRRIVRAAGARLGRRREDFERWALASLSWELLIREILPARRTKGGLARETSAPGQGSEDRLPRVELCAPIPSIRSEDAGMDLLLEFAGLPVGVARVPCRRGMASRAAIRRAAIDACGSELSRLAVREGLLERSLLDPVRLRDRLLEKLESRRKAAGAAILPHSREEGTVEARLLPRREPRRIGGSASRRAALPSAAAAPSASGVRAAPERGGSLREGAPRGPVLYAPEIVDPQSISRDGPVQPAAPSRVRSGDTAVRVLQRALPASRRILGARAVADRLPILMYHRVAGAGPDRLARYRVPPDLFEEQMRYLRVSGFYTVDLETWRAAMERRRQLRGRPVLITFDDGYRDFAENAWPVLARHGFTATVFLVAGLLGRASSWDAGFGETAPLLSREEILDLQAEGAEFGSHTVTHAPLTALSAEGIVTEAARSREMLEEALGRRVRAMAYPYGDHDPVVRHLVGACGYDYGLTVREDLSRYYDPPLALPRREVHPGCVGEAFARLVDPIRGGRAR